MGVKTKQPKNLLFESSTPYEETIKGHNSPANREKKMLSLADLVSSGQKGLGKIPPEWVATLGKVKIAANRKGAFHLSYWETVEKGWKMKHPGGSIIIGKNSTPDALAHEIAHEGYTHIPTEERAIIMEDFLKNHKMFVKAYGDTPSQLASLTKEKQKRYVEKYANEVFAMAAAEKATRSTRGTYLHGKGFGVAKEAKVYGLLSKEARAIIDKYVKIIMLGLGGGEAAVGGKNGGS